MAVGHLHNGSVSCDALSASERLARFFPDTQRVQLRAVIRTGRGSAGKLQEAVLIEFFSEHNAIFRSSLPLEFDDLLQVQHQQDGKRSEAKVIAVQYDQERKAVAVQFANPQGSWVNRP